MKILTLPVLMIALLGFYACNKEVDPKNNSQNCRLLQNTRFEQGKPIDSFAYQYNGNGQVENVRGNNYSYALTYNSNRVVSRRYTTPGSTQIFARDTVYYTTSGAISKIERYNQLGTIMQTTAFNYTNNKLTSIAYFDKDQVQRAKYDYTYTINNITTISADESWNGVASSFRYNLVYNTDANDVHMGQQAFLIDGFLSDHMGLSIIYALSDNHVKAIEQSGFSIPVTYTFDNNKNVTSILVGNEVVVKATYECP